MFSAGCWSLELSRREGSFCRYLFKVGRSLRVWAKCWWMWQIFVSVFFSHYFVGRSARICSCTLHSIIVHVSEKTTWYQRGLLAAWSALSISVWSAARCCEIRAQRRRRFCCPTGCRWEFSNSTVLNYWTLRIRNYIANHCSKDPCLKSLDLTHITSHIF